MSSSTKNISCLDAQSAPQIGPVWARGSRLDMAALRSVGPPRLHLLSGDGESKMPI